MIENYFRPNTLEEAVRLLKSNEISTYPLGGGNELSQHDAGNISVVDLQNLKIDKIQIIGDEIEIGSNITLQDFIENADIPKGLKDAAIREAPINTRQTATLAGTLVSSKGNSPLAVAMKVAGAKINGEPGTERMDIDYWFAKLESGKPARLVVSFIIPKNAKVFYMDISKTPADYPFMYSAFCVVDLQNNWGIGTRKEKVVFISKEVNTMDEQAILEKAYSHFINNNTLNNYKKQIIKVLFHRLIAEAAKG